MSGFKSDSSVNRVLKNGVFTALRFGMHALSGFIFIPFLLKQFGNGTYGLIALAGFLTQYIGLISGCVGMSVSRFMNVALNKNDWKQANEIYSTALISNLIMVCIQLPLFALGIWKLDVIMEFPPELAREFRFLVLCNVAIFFQHMVTGVLFTPIQASNRLDIGLRLDIIRQLLRLVLLFGLILWIGPKLWIIGVVDLALSIIFALITYAVSRRLIKTKLKFSTQSIAWKWARPILKMAGWTLLFTMGQSFFVKTDVWVLNKFLSKEMAGVYAALLVWPNLIRQIGNQVASLVAPVYMIDFAKDNTTRIAEGCVFLSRMLSFFAAILGGVICGAGQLVLTLWLDETYTVYHSLLLVLIIYVVLTLNKAVTWPVFTAFNKVNQLGVTTLCCGVLNLALSITFVRLGYGALGVAFATLISLFLLFGILYPWRVSTILNISIIPFLICHVYTLALFGLVAGGVYLVTLQKFHLAVTVLLAGGIALLGAGAVWLLLLKPDERTRMASILLQVWRKISGLF